jgi:outer membrane protein TolC
VFIDPTTFTPFLVPRDAYRVTVSLSLSELLNRSQHSLAKLELERLMTERSYRLLQQIQSRATLQHYVTALDEEMACLHEERKIIDELLRFNQLRFEQGKIEFDVLMRSKLELLSVQKAMQRIQQQKSEVQLKLLW